MLRTPDGLDTAQEILGTLAANISSDIVPTRKAFEATNMLTIATAVVAAAQARKESRGCHRRTDVVEPQENWRHHITCSLVDGQVQVVS